MLLVREFAAKSSKNASAFFFALPCLSIRMFTHEVLNDYFTEFGSQFYYNLPTISSFVKNRAITDTSYGKRHVFLHATQA
jgi:hypothetical protein